MLAQTSPMGVANCRVEHERAAVVLQRADGVHAMCSSSEIGA